MNEYVCCEDMDFSVSTYNETINEFGEIVHLDEYIEYDCYSCDKKVYKHVSYKPVDDNLKPVCRKCKKSHKNYIIMIATDMINGVHDGKIAEERIVSIESKCKCSIFHPITTVEVKFVIDNIEYLEKLPEGIEL